MEINVSGAAHVEVTEGSIRTQVDSESQEHEVTELDIEGKTVVFWNVERDETTIAICTITIDDVQYQYMLELNESSWKLRLKEKNEN